MGWACGMHVIYVRDVYLHKPKRKGHLWRLMNNLEKIHVFLSTFLNQAVNYYGHVPPVIDK
jgi:hypothetical protein